ncbi:metalloregulator ArsR/SmtB family transcription factor [Rhodococcus sp. H29-C3]|uniref:ArsR/SmtB family transcription factor n=1 Tax=Rhodococcus sp. H29-C3 TaxID=3046307 RepID=UPI0024BB9472|nr:metalloregulator ArsR/SmtB family transcription factor [Rhodococcus sp. H29-C3]MDJ0362022.1 metalloregulator ArsR/SmtB family transcription factor [Rhodococcus sp. H29-C3]
MSETAGSGMSSPGAGAFDPEHVTQARAAIDAVDDIGVWVQRFDLLGDPTRLRILLCMHRAPGICVTDLASALEMTPTSVSHALRLLRNEGWVVVQREGKKMTYRLDDDVVHGMLHQLGATHARDVHE